MQPRNSHPFFELFEYEEKYSINEIIALLQLYWDSEVILPLLDNVTFTPPKGDPTIDEGRYLIARIHAKKDEALDVYERTLSIIKNATPSQGLLPHYNQAWNIIFPKAQANLYCLSELGELCKNLGEFYSKLEDNNLAARYHLAALQIKIISHLLSPHQKGTDIANSFNALAVAFYKQQQYRMSEMCFQYALTIAIDSSQYSNTNLICTTYLNSSLNYIAWSKSQALIVQNDPELADDLELIDHALYHLTLAETNLKLAIKSKAVQKDAARPLRLISEYRLELNILKSQAKTNPLKKAESKQIPETSELTEEQYMDLLMEETVKTIIKDDSDDYEDGLVSTVLVPNQAQSTTTHTAPVTTRPSEAKKVFTIPLQHTPSLTAKPQDTAQILESIKVPECNVHRKFEPSKSQSSQQKQLQQQQIQHKELHQKQLLQHQQEQQLRRLQQQSLQSQQQPQRPLSTVPYVTQSMSAFFIPVYYIPCSALTSALPQNSSIQRTKDLGYNAPLYYLSNSSR